MTDNEIIKALECCSSQTTENTCGNCPLFNIGRPDCYRTLAKHSLDLINRQQAEIERLQKVNDSFTDIGKLYSEIKADAIKEFAEELKQRTLIQPDYNDFVKEFLKIIHRNIDNLVKEMVGEE